MKQFLTLILAILCSTSIALATTYTGTTGDCTYTLDTSDSTLVISGTGAMADYTSSSSVPWYSYRSYVKTVTIEDGVTSIGSYAFRGSTSLTSVIIGSGVTSIGSYAFRNCSSLTSITSLAVTPPTCTDDSFFSSTYSSATLYAASCDYQSATYWSNFTNISEIPCGDNLTWLYCDGTLTISGSGDMYDYSSADEAPWYSYASSITSITLSSEMTSIGDYAFYGLSNITSIEIPESVTSIGSYAFMGCNILFILCSATTPPTCDVVSWLSPFSWTVYSQASLMVQSCYYYTAFWWTEFENIYYEDNGSCGDNLTWEYDGGKTNNVLHNTLTISGSGDMYDYSSADDVPWACMAGRITEIVIDSDVTSISDYAFYNCTNVTSVTSSASATPTIYSSTFSDYSATLYAGSPEYLAADYWKNFSTILGTANATTTGSCGDNLTYTATLEENSSEVSLVISGSGDMYDYSSYSDVPWYGYASYITSVTLSSEMTSIGDYAFYGLSNITSIEIPESVTTIGTYAFYKCSSLTSITCSATTPPTVDSNYAFYSVYSSATLYVTSLEYLTADYWSSFYYINVTSQPCGDDLEYTLTKSKSTYSLSITGTGDMYDYTADTQPWSSCASKITSISLPSDMTDIGNCAFCKCTSVSSITIPDAVTSIGDSAFYYCSSLTSITIPDAVTTIGDFAFSYCKSLTSITIPDAVTSIGSHVFASCSTLSSVTLPDDLETLGEYMFSGCSKLKSITLPETLTSISNGAFSSTGLTSITIPDAVTSIGDYAFYYCDDFTSTLTLPDAVTSIGDYAFYYCQENVPTLPDNLATIGDYAFYYCSTCNVTIPDKVKTIGKYAFYGAASSSYSLVLGSSVEYIGSYAFSNSYFKKITSSNPTPPACYGTNVFSSYAYKYTYLYAESNLYEQAYVWEDFKYLYSTSTAKEVTTIIGLCGDDLTYTLSLSDSTLVIEGTGDMYDYGDNSRAPWYNYASFITSITLPDAMTSVGDYAFYNCSGITSLDIPSSLTSVGDYGFYDCDGLTSITLPDGVTSIGDYAFYSCGSLTGVTIPDAVTSIGNYAFSYCYNLTSIDIPDNVTSIGDAAFRYCSGLTSVTIGNGVTTIGEEAFYDCDDMTSLVIGSSVETIGEYAFYYCTSLTSVTSLAATPPTFIISSSYSSSAYPFSTSTYSTATLYAASTDYYTADYWKNFNSIIYKVYGTCGDGLTWSFNDGTLTISGSGDMYTYDSTDDLPWADFASAVTDIIITSGVTSITDSAFYACENVETVSSYSTTPPTLAESAFNSTTYSSATLGVTSTNYLRADNWKNFSTTTTISADDEPEEETYSNAISSATASISTIRAAGSAIVITTETAQTAQVYSLAGQLLVKQTVAAGETTIGMSTGGIYVVALNDGTRAKVLVK